MWSSWRIFEFYARPELLGIQSTQVYHLLLCLVCALTANISCYTTHMVSLLPAKPSNLACSNTFLNAQVATCARLRERVCLARTSTAEGGLPPRGDSSCVAVGKGAWISMGYAEVFTDSLGRPLQSPSPLRNRKWRASGIARFVASSLRVIPRGTFSGENPKIRKSGSLAETGE